MTDKKLTIDEQLQALMITGLPLDQLIVYRVDEVDASPKTGGTEHDK